MTESNFTQYCFSCRLPVRFAVDLTAVTHSLYHKKMGSKKPGPFINEQNSSIYWQPAVQNRSGLLAICTADSNTIECHRILFETLAWGTGSHTPTGTQKWQNVVVFWKLQEARL